jgi:hypothetical protein
MNFLIASGLYRFVGRFIASCAGVMTGATNGMTSRLNCQRDIDNSSRALSIVHRSFLSA